MRFKRIGPYPGKPHIFPWGERATRCSRAAALGARGSSWRCVVGAGVAASSLSRRESSRKVRESGELGEEAR